ncbi:MAG: DNA gyrase C-terminal beta-propeller domain-containing protein, partial [Gaiella sp.]
MATDGIKRSGRSTQGVIVMRLREGEHVSTLAPVVGSDEDTDPVTDVVTAVGSLPDVDFEPGVVETDDGGDDL